MASRLVARFASRRFSSGGRILSEEEKAAENVYIKKIEQEKLEKLARKGPKPEEAASASASANASASVSASEAKPTSASTGASSKVSTDKHRNYAVVAGVVTIFGALGWYVKGTQKKPEIQD